MADVAHPKWKRIAGFVRELNEAGAQAPPPGAQVVLKRMVVKYHGEFGLDKDGGFSVGGKVDAPDIVTTVVSGGSPIPVSVEGGLGGKHHGGTKSDLDVELEYGPP